MSNLKWKKYLEVLLTSVLLVASTASALPMVVTIDTSGIAGTNAQLALNFIDGGTPTNSASLSSFSTSGVLGSTLITGSVSGVLPNNLIFSDDQFFNEYLVDITLGSSLSFNIDLTMQAPDDTSFPDSFSLFLLDPSTGQSLLSTSDPTGANALLLIEIDGSLTGNVAVYPVSGDLVDVSVLPTSSVPEPGTLTLVSIGLLGALLGRFGRVRGLSLRLTRHLLGLVLGSLVLSASAATDVSDRVEVIRSGLVFNRATNTYDTTVTLTNRSEATISSPVTLVVSDIQPGSVTLANVNGNTEIGKPFVNIPLPGDSLLSGATVSNIVLKFSNPSRAKFNIVTQVFGELPSVPALPEVQASPIDFLTNTSTQVRFQAQILPNPGLVNDSIKLYEVDAKGSPVGSALCSLLDNGELPNGDDIAGDNIYSCFVPFLETSPRKIHTAVLATVNGNSLASPILILNVVAPLSNADAELLLVNQARAEEIWQQQLPVLGDTLQARLAAVTLIKQLSGVSDAGVSEDGFTIWIEYTSGVSGGLMLNPPGTRGSSTVGVSPRESRTAQPSADQAQPPVSFPRYTPIDPVSGDIFTQPFKSRLLAAAAVELTFVENTNVLIWDAYNSEFAPFDEGPDLQKLFQDSQCPKFDVTYLVDAQATVDSVRTFTQYGTVILVTHGAIDGDGQVVFLTRERTGLLNIIGHTIDLVLKRISIMGSVFAIRPSFITSLSGGFPNAIIYNGSCESSGNATMSNAFTSKGAKTYYGYTKIVNSDFAQSSANKLFNSLVTELKTTDEAFTPVTPKTDPSAPFAVFTQSGDTNVAYTGDFQNGDFEKGNLTSWTSAGDGRVVTGLGDFAPTERVYMGLLSTGLGFTTTSGSISQNFCLAKTATKLRFRWNFSSEEFIEYCNTAFDDSFQVILTTDGGTHTLFNKSINGLCAQALSPTSLFFDQSGPGCVPTPANVGFGTGGNDCKVWSTGWHTEEIDVSSIAAANDGKGVTLQLRASDVGDSIYDSAILLDQIEIVKP